MRIVYVVIASIGCGFLVPKGMYLEAGAASVIIAAIINCLVDIKEAIERNK